MTTWKPAVGEVLLARHPVSFATGAAGRVKDMRWFRDPDRKDIQDELPDWPAGPNFSVRPAPPKRRARTAGRFGLGLLFVIVAGAIEAAGGASGNYATSGRARAGKMKEAANEELDFPVMWGARGSLARSLPWQLDPGRCPDGYQTHGILTDRRLVIVGFPDDDPERDEVLWEVGRSDIAGSEKMPYSLVGGDVKITFSDDSWIRIAPHYHHEDWPIMRHLTYGLELVIRSELTSRQKKYVDKCCKREEKYNKVVDCVVTRSPKDRFLIEITPDPNPAPVEFGIIKRCKFMSKRGHQGPRTFSGF